MLSVLLVLALSQTPPTEERLRRTELSLGATGVGTAYTFRGGRFGDFSFGPDIRATGLIRGFTLQGSFLYSVPYDSTGATAASTLTGRIGYTGQRFQILGGAVVQVAPGAAPAMQLLPSFRGEAKFTERLRFSAALFELHGFVPLQLAWEQDDFFLGYAAPLGVTAGFRTRISEELQLDVRAVAFRLYNTELALISISGVAGAAR